MKKEYITPIAQIIEIQVDSWFCQSHAGAGLGDLDDDEDNEIG